ncbi:hypothetical protein HBI20_078880 [Parastagonospora nodorum]|nr:hypothetical protein HBI20_078880 [Parastagonospora nodorum]
MGTPRCLSGPCAHFYWPPCATFTGHCAAIAPIPRFRPSCAPIFLSATRKRTLYCRLRPATSGCLFRRSSVEDANRYGDLTPCRQTCEGSLTGRQDPWQSQHTSTLRQRKRVIPTSCRWLQSLHPRPVPSRPHTAATLRFVRVPYYMSHLVPCCLIQFLVPHVRISWGKLLLKKLVWRKLDRAVLVAIARGGRAAEVGPLRLLVVLPG